MSLQNRPYGARQPSAVPALLALLVAAALIVAAFAWSAEAILRPWLVAWVYTLGLSAGATVLILTHALLGGIWLRSSMPLFRPMALLLPVVALLGLPLLFELTAVYHWAGTVEAAAHLDVALIYLNPASYILRYAIILGLWSLMGVVAGLAGERLAALPAAVMLLAYGITVTLGATDWMMSLDADWASTAFPAYFAVLQLSSAIAAAAVATRFGVNVPATEDLGKLLIGMALGLTYLQFIQYLVMWSGNLPDNVIWYIPRADGLWQVVNLVSFFVGALFPFVLMLPKASRQSASRVSAAGVAMLVGIAVQDAWIAATSLQPSAAWLLPLSLLGVTGLWLGLLGPAASRLRAREARHG